MATTARRLIDKNGREMSIIKLGKTFADPSAPWRGQGNPRQVPDAEVAARGVFVPLYSQVFLGSGEKESKGLMRGEQICLVAAPPSGENLVDFDEIVDDEVHWKIVRPQVLRPGATSVMYAFEVRR